MPYWTLEDDFYAYECETLQELEDKLNEKFAEELCEEGGMHNGEVFNATVGVVLYDADEEKVLQESELTLEYEHYHGDFIEHNTWW